MVKEPTPTLWVYLTHYQPDPVAKNYRTRYEYLATSVFYLSQISNFRVKVLIVSNQEVSNFSELAAPFYSRLDESSLSQYIATESEITFNGTRYDWLLTWVHKGIMFKKLESLPANSKDIFLVLEDDALFTEANLNYFLNELQDIESTGLLPAYVRSEWSELDMCWTHEDPIGRFSLTGKFSPHPNDNSKTLLQLLNPFSASIVLNYDLAQEYFLSESSVQQLACFKHPIIYDIGSSACLGLIMERIPEGYLNRVAVICNAENGFPLPGSVIRHLGDRYAKDKWHRNIRLYDDSGKQSLPTHRSKLDYLKRILTRDGFFVIQKYLETKKEFKNSN